MNLTRSLDEYEQLLAPAHQRFAVSPGIQAIQSNSDGVFLEIFLLNFSALGSQMTEPVQVMVLSRTGYLLQRERLTKAE
jgi:hypothetical protein